MTIVPAVTTPQELAKTLGWSERRVRNKIVLLRKSEVAFTPEDIERMKALANGEREPSRPETVIYFVAVRGFIKIGVTQDWRSRLSGLQSSNPETIEILALLVRPQIYERTMHRKFAAFRVRGEWFTDCKEIREHIASIKDGLLLP